MSGVGLRTERCCFRVVNRYDLACENDGEERQYDHNANSEIERRTGNMPCHLFILIADHIFGEDGNEGRTKRASGNNIKNEIGNDKCL